MKAKTKKKGTGLKVIAWVVLGVLLIAAGGVGGWFARVKFAPKAEAGADADGTAEEQAEVLGVDELGNVLYANETYAMPRAMQLSAQALDEAQAENKTVTVKIKAEVKPDNADNKAVDYLTSWGEGATRAEEPVSDYIEVNQEADGSAEADVVCKKAFGSDIILITVKTRDKGFTATCTVTFVGKADKIEITSSTLSTTSSEFKGEYYALMTDTEYEFDVAVSNIFDELGEYNLEVESGLACGGLYLTTTNYNSMMGNHSLQEAQYTSDAAKKLMSMGNDKDFIQSATLESGKLKLNTGSKKLAVGYYADTMPGATNSPKRYVIVNGYDSEEDKLLYDFSYTNSEITGISPTGETVDLDTMYSSNNAALLRAYFYIRVKDTVSGVTAELRFFLGQSVTGVNVTENVDILG